MFVPMFVLAIALVVVASVLVLFIWQRGQGKDGNPKNSTNITDNSTTQVNLKGRCSVLFGTQTGTAERFSKQLKTELTQRYGEDTGYDVVDVEEYEHEGRMPKEKLVFLMLATYGDGEPTDNAANFFTWVTRAAAEAEKGGAKLLEGVSFAVFGLGNKQYEHFCAVGKRVYAAMESLGATPVVERGDGDDDEDIEADFETWKGKLVAALDDNDLIYKSPALGKGRPSMEIVASDSLASFEVEVLEGQQGSAGVAWEGDGTSARSPFPAVVTMNRELHSPDSDRSCLHVELDFGGSQARYEAGDHVGILAQNEDAVVERAAAALGLSPSMVFSLRLPAHNPHQLSLPFTGPLSLREALAWHVDLLSPLNKTAVQALAAFAQGEDAARLRRLLSPEGHDEYKAWQAQSRSLLEMLEEFPSVKPPLGALFGSIAGRMQVRFYSISSSPKVAPTGVHVTCSLVEHPTATGRQHRGVASHQLQRSKKGDRVPAFFRKSTFKLPADPTAPLLMIGPGTGLAPFRGFLQERAALAASGVKLGPAHLFFGCRNRAHDYIYEAELADLRAQGGFTHLHTAFSREGDRKVYVQHHLEQHRQEIWPLIESGGYIYVCGEAKNMAKDVHKTLLKLAEMQPGGPEKFMAALSDSGRYQKDVW